MFDSLRRATATATAGPVTGDAGRGFVDVNTSFGPTHGTAGTAGASLALLTAERRRHGIRLSLASSLVATWADSATGNRIAAEAATDPTNGVAAVAIVGPRRTADIGRVVDEAERSGTAGYRLEGWDGTAPPSDSVREVLARVAITGRPLLVAVHRSGSASVIGAATAELGIPVVLLGAHYTHIVDDLAAAARHPHLHLETSALAHYRAVETAVRTIGAERLLFGTGSPARAAASPIGAVLSAAIPDDAKRAILGGNAVRLFDVPAGPVDLTMTPVPERAFDVHTHLGPLEFDVPYVADASLVRGLQVPRTQTAIASAGLAIFGDPERGNAQMAHAVAAGQRDGLRGYVVADPTDIGSAEDQLRRYLDGPGVLGVKVHGEWSGTPTASRPMGDLFDVLARFGRPVKIHNAGDGWDEALGRSPAAIRACRS